jgi:glyoxylase-like metal-dependent hydrolase (beta-lactamase superfamily II)
MTLEVSEVASGVFLVVGSRTNWVLVREGEAVTLVDAAWPKDYPRVVESLERAGASPAQVEAVVLTHAHPDHAGVAERFRTDHDAQVHAHQDEVGHATGEYVERVRVLDLLIRVWRPSVVAFALNGVRMGFQHPTTVTDVSWAFPTDPWMCRVG